jgi:SAM-dependent MidA family methyltransferase
MKISNTKAALALINERARLIERRDMLQRYEYRVVLTNEADWPHTHDVTEAVDYYAIKQAAIQQHNVKLAEIATQLKELGVYIDTEEAVMPSRMTY